MSGPGENPDDREPNTTTTQLSSAQDREPNTLDRADPMADEREPNTLSEPSSDVS
jgi:hypothetical protein